MTLARVARRQGGVFTRRQALQLGVDRPALERRLLDGVWMRVMGDVLMATTTPVTPLLQAWTGLLTIGQPVALAGRFAATFLGLEQVPHVTVPEFVIPDNRRRRELPGVAVRRVRREHWRVIWRGGLPVAPVPVVIRQIATDVPVTAVTEVVQNALRTRAVAHEQLLAQLGRGLPGSARLRRVPEELAPGYQVMWERRLHRALLKAGVRLKPQTPVRAEDGRVAYLDLGDEELRFGVEIDGFLNHMARFAADRRRARLLAVELKWTIAPYAVEELAADFDRVVAEIVGYVRRLRRDAA